MRRRLTLYAVAILGAAGCNGGIGIEPQGSVETGGGSRALAFVELGGPALDVAAISFDRGTVEVLTQEPNGTWMNFGSFYAGGAAEAITSGHVGDRGVVAIRDLNGSVALSGEVPGMPHRLDFPIQIYRRYINQKPVDQVPPARGIALGDLDGDGNDELLVAGDLGALVVENLAKLLDANPEKPPPGNGFRYDGGPKPNAIAAIDMYGSGRLDLLLTDEQESLVRIYRNHGGRAQFEAPIAVTLPAPGVQIVGVACPDWPAKIVLADGRVVAVSAKNEVRQVMGEVGPVRELVAAGEALAVNTGKTVAVYDACGRIGGPLGLEAAAHVSVAIAPAAQTVGQQHLAVLADDGNTVSLFKVFSGF